MGKQINYYLDYENFKLLAQKALELGCTIIANVFESGKSMVTETRDIAIITEDRCGYCFHLPEAGKIQIREYDGGSMLERGFNECQNSIIEASYSMIKDDEKVICSSRLHLTTGYYDKNEVFIYCPDCIVKVYNSLARYVKKLAPYTELTDTYISMRDEDYLQPVEYKHKEYITPYCLDLRENKGYKLR